METLAVRKKRADMKTFSKCNWKNPTNIKALKLKNPQNELASNRKELEIEKILRKNQNGFRKNRSITSQNLTIHRILGGVIAKILA